LPIQLTGKFSNYAAVRSKLKRRPISFKAIPLHDDYLNLHLTRNSMVHEEPS